MLLITLGVFVFQFGKSKKKGDVDEDGSNVYGLVLLLLSLVCDGLLGRTHRYHSGGTHKCLIQTL